MKCIKYNLFVLILRFVYTLPSTADHLPSIYSSTIEDEGVFEFFRKKFAHLMNITLNDNDTNITPECKNIFSDAYVTGNKTELFYHKLFKDSSKNKNDVGSLNECKFNKYNETEELLQNFSYLVVSIDLNVHNHQGINTTLYETYWYMLGLCVASGCSDEDYQEVLFSMNSLLGNCLELESKDSITVYSMTNHRFKGFQVKYVFFFIPLYILLLQILFVFYPRIPMCLVSICFKSKDNKTALFKFKSSFDISENSEELFSTKISMYNNDSGLIYIRGIRGISMVFLVFGFLYFNLYTSPIKIYGERAYISLLSKFLFGIIFFGLRFAPRILFSCSGFCLVFKFLCYLDDYLDLDHQNDLAEEKKKDRDNENLTCESRSSIINNLQLESSDDMFMNTTTGLVYRDPDEISYVALWKFFSLQIHKYLLVVYVVCFLKYTLYYILLPLKEVGPIWVFFKINIMDNVRFYNLAGHLLLFGNYEVFEQKDRCVINIFWMVFNECTFFIMTTILLFMCYKKKMKMDRVILFLIVVLIGARFAAVNLHTKAYPTLYNYVLDYGRLFINFLYNYPFYLIGVLFGMLNYVLQKEMNFIDSVKQEKPYLVSSISWLIFLKDKSKLFLYFFGYLGIALLVLLSIVQPLFLALAKETSNNLNYFFVNPFLNNFFLIDIELAVIFVHFIGFVFYLKGENVVNRILSDNSWDILNKLYFCFILFINPVIIYMFYQSETRIKLDLFNVFFYSVIAGFLLFFIASFNYIFFELPFKRLSKLFTRKDHVNTSSVDVNSNTTALQQQCKNGSKLFTKLI